MRNHSHCPQCSPAPNRSVNHCRRSRTMRPPKLLPLAEQFLLTTLVVKLAVMAALATMLARYRRFRHILIFERRDWPDRLFALGLGVPLAAGVASRLLLNYDAADLTLEGAFLAGLIAGPYAGAIVGALMARPGRSSPARSSPCPSPSAAGSPAAACASSAQGRHLALLAVRLHQHPRGCGAWCARLQVDWQVVLLFVPIGLELIRQALGLRLERAQRLFYLACPSPWLTAPGPAGDGPGVATPDQDLEQRAHRASAPGAGEAAARGEDRGAREPDQPALPVQHADLDLVAHPIAARNGAHGDLKLSGLLRRLLRSHGSFRDAARGARIDRRVPRHRGHPLRPAARVRKEIAPDTLDVIVPSMILQPLVENSIKHGLARKVGAGRITIRSVRRTATRSSRSKTTGWAFPKSGSRRRCRRHRPEQRQRAAARDLRRDRPASS